MRISGWAEGLWDLRNYELPINGYGRQSNLWRGPNRSNCPTTTPTTNLQRPEGERAVEP